MADETKQYVDWFRHSSPYINAYRGRVFVILLPGEALAHDNFQNITHDIALLSSLGVKLVLVYGARPQIGEALKQAGINAALHNDSRGGLHQQLRVTDLDSLQLIKQVVGKLRIDIEARFSMGLINSPMHGADINVSGGNYVIARPYGIHEGIDYAHTGEIRKVDATAINAQLAADNIVLLSNLGYSSTGEVFNLTAEEVALASATALAADKLLIYSEEAGILDQDGKAISKLSADQAQTLIDDKIKAGGLDRQLQNLELSVKACRSSVKRSQVISFTEDGALLKELFTRDGIGTLITQDRYEEIRDARDEDIGGILELIQPMEKAGTLVHRSRERLENEIERFVIVEREGTVVACGAFYPHSAGSAELACVATHDDYRDKGYGRLILERIEQKAAELGIDRLFVLTTKSPHWFLERGFRESSVDALPEERKNLYNYQRNSKVLEKNL